VFSLYIVCYRLRQRYCTNPFPMHGGRDCSGRNEEKGPCLPLPPCPSKIRRFKIYFYLNFRRFFLDKMNVTKLILLHQTVHCLFAEWGGWSKCSHSCGNSNGAGTRIRYRYIAVEARYGGMRCYGSKDECSPCIHCASKPPGYDGPCIGFCPGKVLAIVVVFVGLEKFF
jgi:hypothetical protein